MKSRFLFAISFICSLSLLQGKATNDHWITFQSLLQEMTNRDVLAQYPTISYKALQASSYNRESVSPSQPGWFADSDGVSCLRTETINGQQEWVMMEDFGPGCIAKIWAVCFYYSMNDTIGGNISIYLDGAKEPVIRTNLFAFVKGQDFVKPPFADVSTRAGNSYLPIPYQKGCKITLDKKAFYYLINYRSYAPGTPIKTFTMDQYRKCKHTIASVGKQLNEATHTKRMPSKENKIEKKTNLAPQQDYSVILPAGSHAIKTMSIRLKAGNLAQALRSTILKATFDDEETIWCPVGDFFNNGVGIHPYKMWERSVLSDGTMECRWVMPYKQAGKITLHNLGEQPVDVEIKTVLDSWKWTPRSMYFHTSWRMDNPTPTFPLFDWNLLEVKGKGVYVGDQFTVLNPSEGWWGEGDEKIYIDEDLDKQFPSHFGTGTEDYYGWAGGGVPNPEDQFSKPFLANVLVGKQAQGYNTCSRTRVMDAIPFTQRIKFDMESSCGTRQSWFHLVYAATSFWYALPGATCNKKPLPQMAALKLMTTQELQQINTASKANKYTVDKAIECEHLNYQVGKKVSEQQELKIWGEISNNSFKAFKFKETGSTVSVRITEQFKPATIYLCAIVSPNSGIFDILINGKQMLTHNFISEHPGVTTPYLNLGICQPVNNAFDVQFVYKGKNEDGILGLDFFLIDTINQQNKK